MNTANISVIANKIISNIVITISEIYYLMLLIIAIMIV